MESFEELLDSADQFNPDQILHTLLPTQPVANLRLCTATVYISTCHVSSIPVSSCCHTSTERERERERAPRQHS